MVQVLEEFPPSRHDVRLVKRGDEVSVLKEYTLRTQQRAFLQEVKRTWMHNHLTLTLILLLTAGDTTIPPSAPISDEN